MRFFSRSLKENSDEELHILRDAEFRNFLKQIEKISG